MRTMLLAVLGAIAMTSAHAADVYVPPPPAYGAAPPPAYGPPPPAYGPPGYAPAPTVYVSPPAYVQPPRVYYGEAVPQPYYGRPRTVIAAPEGPAYVVPAPASQPGDEYVEAPAFVDGRRYYRNCWWNWGYRRCGLF